MLSAACPGLPALAGLQAAACTSALPHASRLVGALVQRRSSASTVAEDAAKFAEETPRSTVTINGRKTTVPEGTSILSAASKLGIHVSSSHAHPPAGLTPARRARLPVAPVAAVRLACWPFLCHSLQAERGPISRIAANKSAPCPLLQIPTLCTHPRLPTTPGVS